MQQLVPLTVLQHIWQRVDCIACSANGYQVVDAASKVSVLAMTPHLSRLIILAHVAAELMSAGLEGHEAAHAACRSECKLNDPLLTFERQNPQA